MEPNTDIPIIYEDEDLLAINKPAGVVVHTDGRTIETSVVDWIRLRYPALEGVGEPFTLIDGTIIERPGIVHRLDRDTSGVLLIAKKQTSFLHLKEQFQSRSIQKRYLTFVYGVFREREREGEITLPIGRSRRDFRKWAAGPMAKTHVREARTEYRVLKENREASYLEVLPKTGRTHQIRVHLSSVGHPVVGDSRYAPDRPAILGFERLALHASALTFTTLKGDKVMVEAPLPADFRAAIDFIQR